jgi:hypothetical protein
MALLPLNLDSGSDVAAVEYGLDLSEKRNDMKLSGWNYIIRRTNRQK